MKNVKFSSATLRGTLFPFLFAHENFRYSEEGGFGNSVLFHGLQGTSFSQGASEVILCQGNGKNQYCQKTLQSLLSTGITAV